MYSPRVLPDAGVSESQNWAVVEFFFTASAAGTAHTLISQQSMAAQKVFFITGNGTADMSAAVANALVKRPDGKGLDAVAQLLSTGLQTYMTNIPAAADGVFCHAFAVGGLSPTSVLKAEIVVSGSSTSAANPSAVLVNQSAPTVVHTVQLNGSNAFLQDDGSTAIAAGTNTLCIVGGQGSAGGSSSEDGGNSILFGAIASTDVLDTIAAGDRVALRLYVKC